MSAPLKETAVRSRTLLLTLDAFGTIFHPRAPVPEQYAAVAHEYGLSRTAITPQKLKAAFKETFAAQTKRYPNYGRADFIRGEYGGPKQWWEEVIRGSFTRALTENTESSTSTATASSSGSGEANLELPAGMVETLFNRFAGKEGYALYDDVVPFFARLRKLKESLEAGNPHQGAFDRVFVGIISNSDDRVPAILRDLGLQVGRTLSQDGYPGTEEDDGESPEEYHPEPTPPARERPSGPEDPDPASLNAIKMDLALIEQSNKTRIMRAYQKKVGARDNGLLDLDMVVTSFEAGKEKPSPLIFHDAQKFGFKAAQIACFPIYGTPGVYDCHQNNWTYVHVGDDYEKDYCGARDAGWASYLLPREKSQEKGDLVKSISSLVDLFDSLKLE